MDNTFGKLLLIAGALLLILFVGSFLKGNSDKLAQLFIQGSGSNTTTSTTSSPSQVKPYRGDAQRLDDINNIKLALVNYKLDTGEYPEKLGDLVPKYLSKIPTDPKSGEPYYYGVYKTKADFILKANLDTGEEYTVQAPAPGRDY